MYEKLQDVEWLKTKYVDELNTLQAIADIVGCNKQTVWRKLNKYGIKRRKSTSKYKLLNDKAWLHNAYVVEQRSIKQIAEDINTTPGNIHSHLQVLGIRTRDSREAHELGFPEGRFGDKAANWKGGRIVKGEYIFTYAPNHPQATKDNQHVQEHRLVMEKVLGRYLEPYEVVHHRDGNKKNNDPDNLEVKTRGRHVSEHFKASHEVLQMREELERLRKENAELRARLNEHPPDKVFS